MGLRHFDIELTVLGPVHVGNGETLGGKDYFLPKGSKGDVVAVLDAKGFVSELGADELDGYSRLLEESSRTGLQDLFDEEPKLAALAERHASYKVNTRLSRRRGGGYQYFDVAAFVKDPYGSPYIPGSSMKGIIRTALLCEIISMNPKKYREKYDRREACDSKKRKTAAKRIEHEALWLEDTDGDPKNIRDIMHFISVSDSNPVDASNLVFVKKYDKFSKTDDGSHKHDVGNLVDEEYLQGNDLNIYRECLKPGTQLIFHVGVDERIDGYFPEDLKVDAVGLTQVLRHAHELYKEAFLDAFDTEENGGSSSDATTNDGQCRYTVQSGPLAGRRCPNHSVGDTGYCRIHADVSQDETTKQAGDEKLYCYVGGGTDYSVKTVVKALFSTQEERVDESSRILYSQFPSKIDPDFYGSLARRIETAGFEPKEMRAKYKKNGDLDKAKDDHRHWKDSMLGVSPHTMKLGKFEGKKLQMGKCEVRLIER